MPGHKAKSTRLDREHWVGVGLDVLSSSGIEAVRVETLAKRLRISKGSFYWHFKDREDLLDAMLASWEAQQSDWSIGNGEQSRNAAQNWANLLEVVSRPQYGRLDLAIFSWAREDESVRRRVSEVEKRRLAHLARIFRAIGFHPREAEEWAGATLLAYIGWVDRATRDAAFRDSGPDLPAVLSRIILAASALASQET
ncbi:MAG TPA: TetR/AcrR family transcriptional regulator [Candidatus Acidoferrales bacterium]|nr:TetR/AcrR family transcriptional regulator [Candidatus Acidoferrales bacterium]